MRMKLPKSVLIAVLLLAMAHAAGLWEMIAISHTLGVPLWMPYIVLVICYSFIALLLTMLLRGKRWARTTYTALAAFGLLATLTHATGISTLGLTVLATKIVAVVLLYVSASNQWFNRDGPNNSFKPTPLRGAA